jgi:hypothetical protein
MTTQVENTFVTREEFREAIADLRARVTGLENLANRLGYAVDVPETETVPESVSDADAPSVSSNGSAPAVTGSGVDYPAVAFGLTSLRDEIRGALGSSPELSRRYSDAVAWFVSCFSGDPAFDADTFRQQAGV